MTNTRDGQTDRQTETDRDRETETETETDRQTDRETERDRDRDRELRVISTHAWWVVSKGCRTQPASVGCCCLCGPRW